MGAACGGSPGATPFLNMEAPEAPASQAGSDPWHGLSRFTPARIAQGRAGGSQRTSSRVDFRMAHALARDAVSRDFCPATIERDLRLAGLDSLRISTNAGDRQVFLKRPDLGRMLSPASRQVLAEAGSGWGGRDLLVIISDGLSALAAERHAAATLAQLLPLLSAQGWSVYPVLIAPFARVKLQDEVGALLGARHSLMLLGERPGLGSPDSLGAYFTFLPGPGRTDADRNCVSNIRTEALPPREAALKLARLLCESARLGTSGTRLRDSEPQTIPVLPDPPEGA